MKSRDIIWRIISIYKLCPIPYISGTCLWHGPLTSQHKALRNCPSGINLCWGSTCPIMCYGLRNLFKWIGWHEQLCTQLTTLISVRYWTRTSLIKHVTLRRAYHISNTSIISWNQFFSLLNHHCWLVSAGYCSFLLVVTWLLHGSIAGPLWPSTRSNLRSASQVVDFE